MITAKYGSWKSPITSNVIASGSIKIEQVIIDHTDIYWLETRPLQQGRIVIVQYNQDGKITDITPESYNVESKVHDQGGGEFIVSNGVIYFANKNDQHLYRQTAQSEPNPITKINSLRYADLTIDKQNNRLICIREDHRPESLKEHGEAINTIVSINLETLNEQIIIEGNDFYHSPRLSPDASHLAWITWNHPNMPWDKTELWIGKINPDGSIGEKHLVIKDVSVFQPEWSPDGILYFVAEQTGWWNLYRWRNETIETLYKKDVEFGRAKLTFGVSFYAFSSASEILCTYCEQGQWKLALLNISNLDFKIFETPYTEFEFIRATNSFAVFCVASPTIPWSIVRFNLEHEKFEVIQSSSSLNIEKQYFSIPEIIKFPTEQNLTAYGFFYPPQNPDYTNPSGDKPPLLVQVHGGPISATTTAFDLEKIQYWTSRGFAVVDINYTGSMGYGQDYRERLKGNWGIVDVDDCVNAVKYLINENKVNPENVAITGGSAGGYTTLSCLTFRDIFKAGSCLYGIGNLETLPNDTAKPLSRYLDGLVVKSKRWERSPINFCEHLSCPVIFFHGLDDVIVQPRQTEQMVKALLTKKLPVSYFFFIGEAHGFKRSENIKRVLDAQLYFYSRIFGFDFSENLEPVLIENLPSINTLKNQH
jgi:dipeptidyl aminopeptidase/acylaminoacyl peptidase